MSYEEKDTCHTAAGKGRDFPVVINAPNSNDVEIVCRIVECQKRRNIWAKETQYIRKRNLI